MSARSVLGAIKQRVMRHSRAQKVEQFYALCHPESRILDVGVSAEVRGGPPNLNFFLKNFRYADHCYTGLGVHDLSGMPARYPGKRFVQYSGGTFPFGDNEFDWVFSNAVVEHVGDDAAQLCFVNEMLRVAQRVYFTTPYKYFPMESHTNLLFLHWHDGLFLRFRRRRSPRARRYQIHLFSIRRLTQVLRASNAGTFAILRNRLAGLVMTLTVICAEQARSGAGARAVRASN